MTITRRGDTWLGVIKYTNGSFGVFNKSLFKVIIKLINYRFRGKK